MIKLEMTGNLTKDPNLRFTDNGKAVIDFTVAHNSKEGEAVFIDFTVWEKMAENMAESLHQGDRVTVISEYAKQDDWTDKNGSKHTRVKYTVHSICPDLRWATVKITKNPKESKEV